MRHTKNLANHKHALRLLAALMLSSQALAADKLPQALIRAEQALANKSADAATLFEHASHVDGESATAEIGMVRAYMASGHYRRAVSYANLVQGEHKTSSEALAWTAFLNDRSGQTLSALQALESARRARPDDVALLCAQSEILIDRQQHTLAIVELDKWLSRNATHPAVIALRQRAAIASGDPASRSAWQKLSPQQSLKASIKFATRDAETAGAWRALYADTLALTHTASGLVIDDGRHVITALSAVQGDLTKIRIRDARGHVRTARLDTALTEHDIAVLKLDQPLPAFDDASLGAALSVAERIFPGSPFHVVGFPVAHSSYASYPTNTQGFFGLTRRPQHLALKPDLSAGLAGAAVFTASGQLAGFVTKDPSASTMQNASSVFARLGLTLNPVKASVRLSNEEIYEHALNRVVLVAVTKE